MSKVIFKTAQELCKAQDQIRNQGKLIEMYKSCYIGECHGRQKDRRFFVWTCLILIASDLLSIAYIAGAI